MKRKSRIWPYQILMRHNQHWMYLNPHSVNSTPLPVGENDWGSGTCIVTRLVRRQIKILTKPKITQMLQLITYNHRVSASPSTNTETGSVYNPDFLRLRFPHVRTQSWGQIQPWRLGWHQLSSWLCADFGIICNLVVLEIGQFMHLLDK